MSDIKLKKIEEISISKKLKELTILIGEKEFTFKDVMLLDYDAKYDSGTLRVVAKTGSATLRNVQRKMELKRQEKEWNGR